MDLERPGTVFFQVVGEESFKKGDTCDEPKSKTNPAFRFGAIFT